MTLAATHHHLSSRCGHTQGQIIEAISIRERPAEAEDRAIPGYWEGDLISGTKNSHIVTLVERHSRFTTLIKVPSKETRVPAPIVDLGSGTRDGPTQDLQCGHGGEGLLL
jgi:IS30 family transposase